MTPLLLQDPRFHIFRDVLGSNPIPGVPKREYMDSPRAAVGDREWIEWQMIVADPKENFWRVMNNKRRKAMGLPPVKIPQLPRNVVVFDFDESKRENSRDITTILEMLEVPWLCAIPTRTPGNWQVFIGFEKSMWASEVKKFVNAVSQSMGTDPNYNPGTLSWNPIYRTLHPQDVTGNTTIWNPELEQGVYPTLDLHAWLQEYKDVLPEVHTYKPTGQTSNSLTGVRYTYDELVDEMTEVQVGNRHQYLYRYMFKRICEVQKDNGGRVLTEDEIYAIGHETDVIFPEAVSESDITGMVSYFTKADDQYGQFDPLGRQRALGQLSGHTRRERAEERYWTLKDSLLELKAHHGKAMDPTEVEDYFSYHGVDPSEGSVLLSRFKSWDSLPEFTGRKATSSHLASIYGDTSKAIRDVLSRGKKAGYSRTWTEVESTYIPTSFFEATPTTVDTITTPEISKCRTNQYRESLEINPTYEGVAA